MFVQISPSDNDVSETLSSLNFASRVRGIELGPAKKQVDTAELQKVKQMLERSKQEVRLKDESLTKLEGSCQNLENKSKGKEQVYKKIQEKVKDLESQLDSRMHSQVTSEKQQYQLSGKLKEKEEMCTALQQKIAELELNLRQKHQSDSEVAVLKQMIRELELKLKEQEHPRSVAESKIEELELKLKEQEDQRSVAESKAREIEQELFEARRTESMLQIKLQDVEKNLQEKTKLQDTTMMLDTSNSITRVPATPGETKTQPFAREEAMSEKKHRILRSSDSANKQLVSNSSFAAPPEAVNEKKRKGDARNASSIGDEHENNHLAASQNVARKRSLQGEPRVKRTSTEPLLKNPGRPTTATATSRMASAATHKIPPGSRVSRPQQPATSNKTRGWVR